jgi:YD repeat-containing protein
VLSLGGTTPLTTSYAYDGAGDTTAITSSSGLSRQLGYDAQARMVQVTLGSLVTQTVSLNYNLASGERFVV